MLIDTSQKKRKKERKLHLYFFKSFQIHNYFFIIIGYIYCIYLRYFSFRADVEVLWQWTGKVLYVAYACACHCCLILQPDGSAEGGVGCVPPPGPGARRWEARAGQVHEHKDQPAVTWLSLTLNFSQMTPATRNGTVAFRHLLNVAEFRLPASCSVASLAVHK